jgi:hypothetical protein
MKTASAILLLLVVCSVLFGQVISIGTRLSYDRPHPVQEGGYFDATYFDSTYFDTGGE